MIKAKQRTEREMWVLGRQIAYWSILPHTSKKTLKPTHLGRFAWEKEQTIQNPFGSKEALLEEMRKFKEMTERMENEGRFKPATNLAAIK